MLSCVSVDTPAPANKNFEPRSHEEHEAIFSIYKSNRVLALRDVELEDNGFVPFVTSWFNAL
jgi:hypothetical protein